MQFNGISDALVGMASKIHREGTDIVAPKGSWRQVLNNTVTLTDPMQRHLTVLHRNNNPIASIVEAMWVLSGSNEISVISPYLPRAVDFSDDGVTWRAGYGKRMRHFGSSDIDQLNRVFEILRDDPTSRQAVISLYSPEEDSIKLETKDIPCNNWLSFHIESGVLHMSVAIRSNDLVWGWSGINMFEWSVVHQLLAESLGVRMGTVTYLQGNLHMYRTYYDRYLREPYRLVPFADTLRLPFGCTVPSLDENVTYFLATIRQYEEGVFDFNAIERNIMSHYLFAVKLYWLKKHYGTDSKQYRKGIDFFKANVEASDFKTGILLYFKELALEPMDDLSLVEGIIKLHHDKGLVYGNSWCNYGESLSIIPNILRKSDRIEKFCSLSDEERAESLKTEDIYDTVIDLLVYLTKYIVWLRDGGKVSSTHNEEFNETLTRFFDTSEYAVHSEPYAVMGTLVKRIHRYVSDFADATSAAKSYILEDIACMTVALVNYYKES